jgi:hypothetical protein
MEGVSTTALVRHAFILWLTPEYAWALQLEGVMVHRILSLDGGGAWAMLEAMCLADMFDDAPGHQILSQFDLAVANSGGSIVLGGLAENLRPSDMIALFKNASDRTAIFSRLSWFQRQLSNLPIFPRYSTERKLEGLRKAFGPLGDRPLSSFSGTGWIKGPNGADTRLLIVALDYDFLRGRFFRSYSTPHGATADDIPLVEAVHASTDAPVEFFDQPASFDGHRYWDGAMAGMNNPLLAGVIDLLGDGIAASDLVALSIGTGTTKLAPATAVPPPPDDLAQPRARASIATNIERAAGCILDDPPDSATFSTHIILASARGADPTREAGVVRLSAMVRPVLGADGWKVPPGLTADDFQALQKLEMDAVKDEEVALIARLGAAWIAGTVPNQPIRMRSDNLASSLGEELYSAAVARWFTLVGGGPPIVS